jgi:aspartate/methionine/tyrosine aminotransferase
MRAPGLPKVLARVRDAKELMIKKITRETAVLQQMLAVSGDAIIINMSQGSPCLPIFEVAREAMVKLVDTRRLPYSDVAGGMSVRGAAARFVNSVFSLDPPFTAANTIITAGAIQAIFSCLSLSIEGPNDAVLTTLPAYGLYQQQTKHLGGTFVAFGAGQRLPTPQGLRDAFKATNQGSVRVRAVVLCLPNNPTGAVLDEALAASLCQTLDELYDEYRYGDDPQGGFSVILDEVYIGITEQKHVSLLMHASERLRRHTFLVLSCSKGLGAMPGARAAWVTCDAALVPELAKVQLSCTGNACTVSQAGLEANLNYICDNPAVLEVTWAYYKDRTSLVARRLNELGGKHGLGLVAEEVKGAFYVWADFGKLPRVPGKSETDVELAAYFRGLHEVGGRVGVACVPGSAFEVPPTDLRLRLSCAREEFGDLVKAMNAIEFGVTALCAAAAAPAEPVEGS